MIAFKGSFINKNYLNYVAQKFVLDANVEAKKTKRKKRDKREKGKKRRKVHVKQVKNKEDSSQSGEDTEIYVSYDNVKPKDNDAKHKEEDNLLPQLKRQDAMYPEQLKAYLQSIYK